MDEIKSFFARAWFAVKRWVGTLSTEENIFLLIDNIVSQEVRVEIVNLVLETVRSLMSSPIDGTAKFEEAKQRIAVGLDEISTKLEINVRENIGQWMVNSLIELAVAKLKIEKKQIVKGDT